MSDPEPERTSEAAAELDQTSKEIARSLGGIWQDFAGHRLKSIDVEVGRDRVACVIDERVPAPQDGEEPAAPQDAGLSPHSVGYNYRASAAVARITHRRVVGLVRDRDEQNQTSTQVFILRRELRRY